ANHVHHALRGAVDRLRTRGKNGDADRLLVLLDRRRLAALVLRPPYPRPGFHPGSGLRSFRLWAQPLFRVARPPQRPGDDVKGEGRNVVACAIDDAPVAAAAPGAMLSTRETDAGGSDDVDRYNDISTPRRRDDRSDPDRPSARRRGAPHRS